MPAPAVSVVMPVFNGARFLDRALSSLRAQTFSNWELLAVDDASTDDTLSCLSAAAVDARVRVLRHDLNRGPAAARNTGLRAARGAWVAYLDCDDEFYPDHLARFACALTSSDVRISAYDVLEGPDEARGAVTYRHDPASFRRRLLAFGNIATPLGVAHRRELIERVGPFDERLRFEEDAELWRRMARSGARIEFVAQPSGRYHVRPDSLARTHLRQASLQDRLPSRLGAAEVGPYRLRVPENELWAVREVFEGHEYGGLPPGALRSPPVVIDVGANIGLFALYAKLFYHREALVHCFEPYPPAAALLRRNVAAEPAIEVHPVGLGERDELGTMYLHRNNSGGNSLRAELVPDPRGTEPVPIRDAAEVWDALGLDEVDVLKIDAEGAEPDILGRLGDRLKGVRVVLAEYHTGRDRRRLDALLEGHELFAASLHEPGRGVVKYVRSDLVRH
ncbi:MAG TPA: FkbM family methyltransferase [Gemmata sp.]